MDEARLFLSLPRPVIPPPAHRSNAAHGSSEAARRLFQAGRPVPGTPAEAYLRARGITARLDWPTLRFHPSVYYRADDDAELELWPALLAAVTACDGTISGVQRTWLDRVRPAKAPIADPRRAMGCLLGNGVRFGAVADIVAAGEGVETMLALKSVLPGLPIIAGLSANHLAALVTAPALCRPRQRHRRPRGGEPAARTPSRHRRARTRAGICRLQPRPLPPGRRRPVSAARGSARPGRPHPASPFRCAIAPLHGSSPVSAGREKRRKWSAHSSPGTGRATAFTGRRSAGGRRAAAVFLAKTRSRRPDPVWNGAGQLFSAAGMAGIAADKSFLAIPALHRETK
jgi:hypothetical protein